MNWLKKLAGLDTKAAGEVITSVSDSLREWKFTGTEEAEFLQKRAEVLAEVDKAQLALDKSSNAPSWRNAIGWTCAVSFGVMFALAPFSLLMFSILGEVTPITFELAHFQEIIDTIFDGQIIAGFMPVLMGMLGLGALRCYDKKNAPVSGGRRKDDRLRLKTIRKLTKDGYTAEQIEDFLNG